MLKFNPKCKTGTRLLKHWKDEYAAGLTAKEIKEFLLNLHVPDCKKCRSYSEQKTRKLAKQIAKARREHNLKAKKGDRFKVRSFTNPKTSYVVSKQGKKYQCSCPSWIYRRGDCKHINHIKHAA